MFQQRKKPAQRAFTGISGSPLAQQQPVEAPAPIVKSSSAVRAARFRERQKSSNPLFNQEEAQRKKEQRVSNKPDKPESEPEVVKPETLRNTWQTEQRKEISHNWASKEPSFYLNGADRGKAQVVTGGWDTTKIDFVNGASHRSADWRPSHALLSEQEVQKKIDQSGIDVQIDVVRDLLEDWMADTTVSHGRRVAPTGYGKDKHYNGDYDHKNQSEGEFAPSRKSFKTAAYESIKIGNRNYRIYGAHDIDGHMRAFVLNNITYTPPEPCGLDNGLPVYTETAPPVCKLCSEQLSLVRGSWWEHFSTSHTPESLEWAKQAEKKAYRPIKRCSQNHTRLATKFAGEGTVVCNACKKSIECVRTTQES